MVDTITGDLEFDVASVADMLGVIVIDPDILATALDIGSLLGASRRFAMQSRHGTLVASTPIVVTVTGVSAEVINRTGAADIYFTTDGSVPTVAGNDTYVVPAVTGARTAVSPYKYKDTVTVTLISSGTPGYSVIATDTAYVQN